MTYEPEQDWFGKTRFHWKGSDGFVYSKNSAEVEINIVSVNDPPFVRNFEIKGNEDETAWIRKLDFSGNFLDPDNDAL